MIRIVNFTRVSAWAVLTLGSSLAAAQPDSLWEISSTEEWEAATQTSENLVFAENCATPTASEATFESRVRYFPTKQRFGSMTIRQSPVWQNWEPIPSVGPSNLVDAPVFLAKGLNDYWLFGLYDRHEGGKNGIGPIQHPPTFTAEAATLEGFHVPLVTTPYPNQFDAPGGLKPSLGGYHAWQSRDMVNWVHHGPVTEKFSRWVTTAEYADGKTYIYYDYPNDQDPHVYIDTDLTDGLPGNDQGIAFRDPSDGSDCAVIRSLAGDFHVIYEDWSPINAKAHSWDSPLAGHAVSEDGLGDFKILAPAVDERTTPTGKTATYRHPHWLQHPDFDSNVVTYEIHEPAQDAYGDWAAICIGGQYYLFCDYHPVGGKIKIAWFTSDSLDQQFEFAGEIGQGHPDPDIGFAEGKFYLINQTKNDYVSPGPWVESVRARVGVDTDRDGSINQWTDWQEVKESYEHIPGFAKQIRRIPATLDLSSLPPAYGISFEIKIEDRTANPSLPLLDSIVISK